MLLRSCLCFWRFLQVEARRTNIQYLLCLHDLDLFGRRKEIIIGKVDFVLWLIEGRRFFLDHYLSIELLGGGTRYLLGRLCLIILFLGAKSAVQVSGGLVGLSEGLDASVVLDHEGVLAGLVAHSIYSFS